MTPPTPEHGTLAAESSPQTSAVPPVLSPSHSSQRWRWGLFVVVALLLTGGSLFAWSWFHWPVPAIPMPADIQDREVQRAIDRARQTVVDKPSSADAWGKLGMTLLANLFDQDADRCFAEAARLDPRSPIWPYGRGMIAFLKRNTDTAIPLLRQALTLAGSSWPEYQMSARFRLAEALLERHELTEAEELFRQEWQRHPDGGSPRAALGLALVARARGDDRTAMEYLTTPVLRSCPNGRKNAAVQLASLAQARGDAVAADYAREAAALPPDESWPDPLLDVVVRMQVGKRRREREVKQLELQKRYLEAAQFYLSEIKEQPTAPAYVGAGINLCRIGRYDEAQQMLGEALRLDPDSAMAHYTLSLTLFTRAEKEWYRAPGSVLAKEWFRDVITHAQRAAQLKPDIARNYLHWGLALKYLGEPDAAVAPLRKGVACQPVSVDLQVTLGEVLLETGQDEEAQTHLENARILDPDDKRPIQALEKLRQKKNGVRKDS
jgi:tetratricopeptide (TPR) repeat protein